MSPWTFLEISPTSDLKEIKRAYAKKLKVTRPDENPDAFQNLHDAYQVALHIATKNKKIIPAYIFSSFEARDTKKESFEEFDIVQDSMPNTVVPTKEIDIAETQVSTEIILLKEKNISKNPGSINAVLIKELDVAETQIDNRSTALKEPIVLENPESNNNDFVSTGINKTNQDEKLRLEEYHRILQQVEDLLAQHQVGPSVEEWNFIIQCPYILEQKFNWWLGKEIFRRFSHYLQQSFKSRGQKYSRYITRDLLEHCDQIFSWSANSGYLQAEFGKDLCNKIFSELEGDNFRNDHFGLRGGSLVKAPVKSTYEKPGEPISIGTILQILFFIVLIANVCKKLLEG